jgi:DNA-binding XRE family transcriptional regulator
MIKLINYKMIRCGEKVNKLTRNNIGKIIDLERKTLINLL